MSYGRVLPRGAWLWIVIVVCGAHPPFSRAGRKAAKKGEERTSSTSMSEGSADGLDEVSAEVADAAAELSLHRAGSAVKKVAGRWTWGGNGGEK